MKLPELLAPAGNLEKCRYALAYGADAVYIGGKQFGMRAGAGNFTQEEIAQAAAEAHRAGAKLYVTVNVLPRWYEYRDLERYLAELNETGADALIVASPGVLASAKRWAPRLDLHISTQAATASHADCLAWAAMGARRVVLSRELTLEEISEIAKRVAGEVELEVFVHGSMCVSWSGRCLLSAALAGKERDACRGSCAQPCRWNYRLYETVYTLEEEKRPGVRIPIEENERGTFIMSSKDLCMIDHIPELCQSGVASLKIEGRMRSAYYTAVVSNAYRMALDAYAAGADAYQQDPAWRREVENVAHRPYSTGYFFDEVAENPQIVEGEAGAPPISEKAFLAVIDRFDPETGRCFLTQRNKFSEGETVELIVPGSPGRPVVVTDLRDREGNAISSAPHPGMSCSILLSAVPGGLLRRQS